MPYSKGLVTQAYGREVRKQNKRHLKGSDRSLYTLNAPLVDCQSTATSPNGSPWSSVNYGMLDPVYYSSGSGGIDAGRYELVIFSSKLKRRIFYLFTRY